jgi:hypothetical protein
VHRLGQRGRQLLVHADTGQRLESGGEADTGIIDITFGTVAGNRMTGTQIWTLLVGAPSSGKTVMLDAVRGLPETCEVDTFTEAGLLSGASDGTPGVLAARGAYGMLVFPDLTMLISKHSADKSGPMGVLRRVAQHHLEVAWISRSP